MKDCHVLVISGHRLFRESMVSLLNASAICVVAQARSLQAAMSLLTQQKPDVIIVDQADVDQSDLRRAQDDTFSKFGSLCENCKVVFFSPTNDRITVYSKEQMHYTTPDQLVALLRASI